MTAADDDGRHHHPIRPIWTCVVCGDPWPCQLAREWMLRTYTLVPRSLTMASYFTQACEELTTLGVGEIHGRFLGWIRS